MGERVTVRFVSVEPAGAAVARLGPVVFSVPFGVPGEDAVVEVTRGGRRAEARLVALLHKSAAVVSARCQHFGRCGGCQWQHIVLEAQRRFKTRLVKDFLKEHADVRRDLVRETVGGEAWGYRSTVRAVFGQRDGTAVLGFHAAGSSRVVDVAECPVQHPANEAMLRAARHAIRALRLPVYDPASGRGLMRGMLGLTSFATGQALMTLSTAARLPDPAALVHALIDSVPGLVGILNAVQPARSAELLGPRLRLLWGRDHVDEEIAGMKVRLRPNTEMPANARAVELLLNSVTLAAAARPEETALDLTATTPLITLALAGVAGSATGVAPGRRVLADALHAAAINGVTNAAFTTRNPLARAASPARRRPDLAVVTAAGTGLDAALMEMVGASGVPRVVYLARSLATCAHDLATWRRLGYAVAGVYPVDILPQTSHVYLVTALRKA